MPIPPKAMLSLGSTQPMRRCAISPQGWGGALGLLGAAVQAVPTGLSPTQAEAAGNGNVVSLLQSFKDRVHAQSQAH